MLCFHHPEGISLIIVWGGAGTRQTPCVFLGHTEATMRIFKV